MRRRLIGCGFALVVLSASVLAGDEVPAWLRQAAAASVPSFDKKVPAVVLLDESRRTVEEDGRVTTVSYYAIRILSREGRKAAHARASYNTDTEKIREMRAWMIRPSGEVKKYGKGELMETALDNHVFVEARTKEIVAAGDAEIGSVFGFEVATESKSIFTQFEWNFQEYFPVLASRCTLALPKDWRAEGVTFNHAKLEPTITGTTYTWEMRDLPFI